MAAIPSFFASIIICLISIAVTIMLTYMLSRNYFSFLEKSRKPKTEIELILALEEEDVGSEEARSRLGS